MKNCVAMLQPSMYNELNFRPLPSGRKDLIKLSRSVGHFYKFFSKTVHRIFKIIIFGKKRKSPSKTGVFQSVDVSFFTMKMVYNKVLCDSVEKCGFSVIV